MTIQAAPRGYAPYGLATDPAGLGLERIEVTGAIGTAVAYYRRDRPSTRATIFLHGAAGSWTTWTPLMRAAAARGIPIDNPVLIDLPGWGDAHLAASPDAVSIDAVCAIVKDCAEELGYTQWDVVGHSMGGFIALHMASLWPQSVLSVGVVSGTGESIIHSVAHPLRNFRTLPAFTLLWKAMAAIAGLGAAGAAVVRFARFVGALRLLVSPLFQHTKLIDDSVVDALGLELRPGPFAIAANLVRGYDLETNWEKIECPVRALNGDHDVFSLPADLRRLGALIPGSVLAVVADCGHFAAVERPDEVLLALGFAVPGA